MSTPARGQSALPETEVVEAGGVSIYMLHDLGQLDLKAEAAGFRVVVYGHSHRLKIEEKNGVLFFNPRQRGSASFSLAGECGKADDRSGKGANRVRGTGSLVGRRSLLRSQLYANKKADSKAGLFLLPTFRGQECPRYTNYFFGAIASFAAFATRNFTTVFALI